MRTIQQVAESPVRGDVVILMCGNIRYRFIAMDAASGDVTFERYAVRTKFPSEWSMQVTSALGWHDVVTLAAASVESSAE